MSTWEPISADDYYALEGKEGGGMMGCVFLYHAGKMVARRRFINEAPAAPGEATIWYYDRLVQEKKA